jgi:chromosome segregation ATPase
LTVGEAEIRKLLDILGQQEVELEAANASIKGQEDELSAIHAQSDEYREILDKIHAVFGQAAFAPTGPLANDEDLPGQVEGLKARIKELEGQEVEYEGRIATLEAALFRAIDLACTGGQDEEDLEELRNLRALAGKEAGRG